MKKIFGTDGIRGVANVYPMTPEMVLKIGKAVAHVFSEKKGKKIRIVIGKDTRLSGYMIENALTSGIVSAGCDVLLVGPIPTPAIAHLTKSLNCDLGIMLTASHNPAKDNGIKIFKRDGYKLEDDLELEIEDFVLSKDINSEHIQGDDLGKAYRIEDAKGRYIEYMKGTINNVSLNGIKIVLDCANGATYSVAPTIFRELGVKVTVINNKPDGLNINFDCGALYANNMKEIITKEKADIGIAFDGDGDRVIFCDEKGEIIDGDAILSLFALEMKKQNKLSKDTLVVTGYSNLGVEDALKGLKVARTAAGDRYVIEEMRKKGYNLGGENSGHIIFGDYSTTGDGILSALQLLVLLKNRGNAVSKLFNFYKSYPQILNAVKVKEKKPLEKLPSVQKVIQEVEKDLGKEGRTLIRYSGTEPICRIMVEGKDEPTIKKHAKKIEDAIKKEVG